MVLLPPFFGSGSPLSSRPIINRLTETGGAAITARGLLRPLSEMLGTKNLRSHTLGHYKFKGENYGI